MNFDQILKNISRQITLDPAECEFFTSLLERKFILKKNYLTRTNEICRYDYFVISGCLKVCYTDRKGVECIIKFAVENWWVVDLASFLNYTASFYYIQAIEDTELFRLSRTNYDLLHQKIPAFQKFSNERWQTGFIALQQRIIQNLSLTAEERYRNFQQKYPNLEQRISQKLIAAYLGITPEFFSMMRKKQATIHS
jgi:CRP-like cAMP-binding protein